MAQSAPLFSPERLPAGVAGEIPFLRLPDPHNEFAARARRLEHLAAHSAMGDYLGFVAHIARAQAALFDQLPPLPLPSAEELAHAHAHSMPPLNARSHRRDPAWRGILRQLLHMLLVHEHGPVRDVIARLEVMPDEYYEAQASRLLAGASAGLRRSHAPFIGAALQVYWAHLVATLGEACFPPIDTPTVCPCCGASPTTSIARIGSETSGYRYLHCSLCQTEWQYVRVKCTECEATEGIHYFGIEGGASAVMVECCDECGTCRKILYQDKDPNVDPVADDLASIALDLMVSEQQGKRQAGVNFMLIMGGEEADEAVDAAPRSLSASPG